MATQTQTRTRTFSLSHTATVASAIAEDLDELVNRAQVDLAKSMGSDTLGDWRSSNRRLQAMLKSDIYYLFSQRIIKSISFVFYSTYDATLGGCLLSYEARYEVTQQPGLGPDRERIPHIPFAYLNAAATGIFKIVVDWSDFFLNNLTEGERAERLSPGMVNFDWLPPRDNLLRIGLDGGQITAQYTSGSCGVARIEHRRIGR